MKIASLQVPATYLLHDSVNRESQVQAMTSVLESLLATLLQGLILICCSPSEHLVSVMSNGI